MARKDLTAVSLFWALRVSSPAAVTGRWRSETRQHGSWEPARHP
uniref:Pyrin n=1 Tax=Pan troglodytes TaxID=9598 RepID=G2HHI5_PANTR|nr:pyrin [Pan troglodytes]